MRDLRTIIMADRDDLHAERLAGELGVDVLLHEPFMPAELVTHVRRCVGAGARTQSAATDPRKRPSDRMEAERKRPSDRMEAERKRPSERLEAERKRPSDRMEAGKSSRPRERVAKPAQGGNIDDP